MGDILVGKGTLKGSLIVGLGRVDEYQVSTVIERSRERVVCMEPEILAGVFRCLKGHAVVDGVPGRVGEVEDPVRPVRASGWSGDVRIVDSEGVDILVRVSLSCNVRRDIQVDGPDQMVTRNEQISSTDRE